LRTQKISCICRLVGAGTQRALVRQQGMALISSLLLLVVVTILALSMFRSFGLEEKIAGNVREKQRALHAAESAEQFAEWWLTQGNAAPGTACNAALSAALGEGQVCSTPLAANNNRSVIATTQVWNGANGVTTYNPGALMTLTAGAAAPTLGTLTTETYFQLPQYYIYDAGPSADGKGEVYQVDALGYGAGPNAAAVVESTFEVSSGVKDLGGP
jgi:type IV pilus assembly protein PilX